MTLWEAEKQETAQLEAKRQQRIAELDAQREKEEAAAALRQEEWRKEDELRAQQEARRRSASNAEKKATLLKVEEQHRTMKEATEKEMAADQAKLDAERLRQEEIRKKREAPSMIKSELADFSYSFPDEMQKAVKAFRQRGSGGDTLIMRIEHELNELQIEQNTKGMSLDDLAGVLEDHALSATPRYVLHIYKFEHRDGRVQYPIAFIVFMPQNIPVNLKVLYTRPVADLCDKFKVNKQHTLDDPEDLTEEWIETKLELR